MLALFAVLGIQVIISAGSLLTLYMGIEIMSLSLYAMVAFDRDNGVAAEAAMKYFVLGAIASGALLYGISILYGVTGTIRLDGLARRVRGRCVGIGLLLGLAFIVVGVAFKFGAVPFHMWLPDVYHGSPTAVTLFIGSAPKIASFALAMRILAEGLGGAGRMAGHAGRARRALDDHRQCGRDRPDEHQAHARVFDDLARRLHPARRPRRQCGRLPAAMFYTLTYVIMATGAFGVVLLMSRKGFEAERSMTTRVSTSEPMVCIRDVAPDVRHGRRAADVGFWAKVQVVSAVLDVGLTWLAAVAVVLSVIGAYYYLRIVKLMYFDEPTVTGPVEAKIAVRVMLSLNGLCRSRCLRLYAGDAARALRECAALICDGAALICRIE